MIFFLDEFSEDIILSIFSLSTVEYLRDHIIFLLDNTLIYFNLLYLFVAQFLAVDHCNLQPFYLAS